MMSAVTKCISAVVFAALPLCLVFMSACENTRVDVVPPAPQPSTTAASEARPSQDPSLVGAARQARAAGDFESCERDYARAAEGTKTSDAAYYFYEAARCAARSGRFDASITHLYEAANAGYPQLADVQTDPLLRPLYGSRRWQLVVDTIAENQRQAPAAEGELCALFERVRELPKFLQERRDGGPSRL